MTVIAMTHEIGTPGRQIGSRLAMRLGIDFADQDFLEHRIADRLARDKSRSGRRSLQPSTLHQCLDVDDQSLARAAAGEIMELAAYGDVLLHGWGAAMLLRNHPGTIRIRVFAPMDFRLRALAADGLAPDETALRSLIERSDACLAGNMEPVLGPGWRSAETHHLMLGAHDLSVDDSVELIMRTIDAMTRQRDRASRDPFEGGREDQPMKVRRRRSRPLPTSAADHAAIARAEQLLFGAVESLPV